MLQLVELRFGLGSSVVDPEDLCNSVLEVDEVFVDLDGFFGLLVFSVVQVVALSGFELL